MIQSLYTFIEKMKRIERKYETLTVGIDGGGAAGKSTLAEKLRILGERVDVVHMDDFYRPSWEIPLVTPDMIGGNFDWEKMYRQVLGPLTRDEPGRYQPYDWRIDNFLDWVNVPVGGIVLIEGCYSIRAELAPLYDLRIWVDSPRDFRFQRGVARDGEISRELWANVWLPAEDVYFAVQHPEQSADIILSGTGQRGDIANFEVDVVSESDLWSRL